MLKIGKYLEAIRSLKFLTNYFQYLYEIYAIHLLQRTYVSKNMVYWIVLINFNNNQ